MKAFYDYEMFDEMKFLKFQINYVILKQSFFKIKFKTIINIVETVFDKFEFKVKEVI